MTKRHAVLQSRRPGVQRQILLRAQHRAKDWMCLTSPKPPSLAMRSIISASGQTVKWGLETGTFSVQTTYSETPCYLVWFRFHFVTIFQTTFYVVLKDTARNTRAAFSGTEDRSPAASAPPLTPPGSSPDHCGAKEAAQMSTCTLESASPALASHVTLGLCFLTCRMGLIGIPTFCRVIVRI